MSGKKIGMLFSILLLLSCVLLLSCESQKNSHHTFKVPADPHINEALGKLFLATNKLQPGVHVLKSGLQFSILKDGMGTHPTSSDLVTVYYEGRYTNGVIFDNQHAKKHPITIRVNALIPGWQEGIKLMLPGSIWVLYIPGNLAYGQRGIPGLVGPNQTLVYTVHLVNMASSASPPH